MNNEQLYELLDEDFKLSEKELYLVAKKSAIRLFNQAVEKNDVEKMKEMRKIIENLEIKFRTTGSLLPDCEEETTQTLDK